MFEKEAEEYAMLNARQYIHNEDIGFCTSEEEEMAEDIFLVELLLMMIQKRQL